VALRRPGDPEMTVSYGTDTTTFSDGAQSLVLSVYPTGHASVGLVSSVVANGETWSYAYNSQKALTTVVGPDPSTPSTSDTVAWTYRPAGIAERPAGAETDGKRQRSGKRRSAPGEAPRCPRRQGDSQRRGHRLGRDRIERGPEHGCLVPVAFGLLPIVGMLGKPCFHHFPPRRVETLVGIGNEIRLGDPAFSPAHLILRMGTTGAPSKRSASAARARDILDMTVPIGIFKMSAVSR
jgi:hypothetical protein